MKCFKSCAHLSIVSADSEAEEPPADRWLGLKVGCSSAASSPALEARMIWKHRLAVGRRSASTDRHACTEAGECGSDEGPLQVCHRHLAAWSDLACTDVPLASLLTAEVHCSNEGPSTSQAGKHSFRQQESKDIRRAP